MVEKEKFLVTAIVPHFFIWELKKMGFQVDEFPDLTGDDYGKIIQDYSGIYVRGSFMLDKHLLSKAEKLKYILRPGSGLDLIDVEFASAKNIHLINSPEGNRDSLGEFVIGALIALMRKIPSANQQMKKKVFDRISNTGTELMDKTVGIIGFGNMGGAFARRLSSFGVRILSYDKYKANYAPSWVEETDLKTLQNESDIISFHIPYNQENHYFFNGHFLNQLKKPFYFINTSRGKIAETQAIITGLRSGKIQGAVIDVFENEDFSQLTKEQREALEFLSAQDQVILTPHIAGKTHESEQRIHKVLLDKLRTFRTNKMLEN